MPLTSLESIAEKLQENRKIQLEDILKVSGSFASSKNEYGITTVDPNNIATSLVFKSLNKPKIDTKEVTKAIDVDVKELKPNIPTASEQVVPKTSLDDQVKINTDLTKQIERLNNQIENLNGQITSLRTQVDVEVNNKLNIEQANDALNNQIGALNKSLEDLAKQIQTAIQKSADESVLRASLQAQNVGFKSQIETLTKQIDSLNSIIEGLQAQLGGVQQPGATTGGASTSSQSGQLSSGGQVSGQQTSAPPNQPGTYTLGKATLRTINVPNDLFKFLCNIERGYRRLDFQTDDKLYIKNNIKIGDTTSKATVKLTVRPDVIVQGSPFAGRLDTSWITFSRDQFVLAPEAEEVVQIIVNRDRIQKPSGAGGNGYGMFNYYKARAILEVRVTTNINGITVDDVKNYTIEYQVSERESYRY